MSKQKPKARLAAVVDDEPLDDDAARELWTRFSQHMDEHVEDAAGFAAKHGYASVTREYRKGQAVLVIKTRRA